MTKIYLLFIFCLTCIVQAKSQTISPSETTEVCPEQDYTFTVTVPGTQPNVAPTTMNIPPYLILQAFNITTSDGNTTFNFKGRFVDDNNNQTFTVNYINSSNQNASKNFTFKRINSLLRPSNLSAISPTPANIQVPRCQIQSFNISFANIPYSNIFANPGISYGTITTYEYLLPPRWMLGTPTSNGSDWIAGNNNVT